ncbi:MAG TPA: hypothetical protein VGE54_01955 [Brevundimonas sp.]
MKRLLLPALTALTLAAALPAAAQTQAPPVAEPVALPPVSMDTVRAVRDFLIAEGLVVGEPTTQNGFPALPIAEPGLTWGLIFFPCAVENCMDVRFSAAFTNDQVTADKVNAWNADRRFLSAHFARTETQSPGAVVNYDVLMLQPGGPDRIGVPLDIWRSGVAGFAVHVGYFQFDQEAVPAAQGQ